MANSSRGEVDFSYKDKNYRFKLNNAGRREAESFLLLHGNELTKKIDVAGLGPGELRTAVFFGVTRKFHARDFPNVASVETYLDDFEDDLMDLLDDEKTEEAQELNRELEASLLAAFFRADKKIVLKRLKGEPVDEDTPEEEAPKETQETKKPKKADEAA